MKIALAVLCALTVAACQSESTPAPAKDKAATPEQQSADDEPATSQNLFQNPSFEAGREPWFSLAGPQNQFWADFERTDARAKKGKHSALLRMTSEGHLPQVRVYGVIADYERHPLPTKITGYYRVENWQRGTERQYVQVVVAVNGAQNMPEPGIPTQLAWVLTGIDEPPFEIRNRRFIFVGPKQPTLDEWVRFELPVREGFERSWGAVPDPYESVRVFFEARYDEREPTDGLVQADVYFDELFLGD
jgi:hypothetical protein